MVAPLFLASESMICGTHGTRYHHLDCLVFLPNLLLVDTSIMAISCVVASMVETSSWSWPPQVKMH
jgi:hypothetical protein